MTLLSISLSLVKDSLVIMRCGKYHVYNSHVRMELGRIGFAVPEAVILSPVNKVEAAMGV